MKVHTKRIRRLRRLALAGCIVAVVAPSSASAMLPNDVGVRHENAQQSQPYSPPAGFRTEVQTPQGKAAPQFALHKGFKPEVQTQAPTQSAPQSPTIVRQIETVSDDSGRTLAIVLASIALAVALGSLAYATIRMTRMQRRELGSH
jgi:hypothetical protein